MTIIYYVLTGTNTNLNPFNVWEFNLCTVLKHTTFYSFDYILTYL